jgi:hypothetical protein
MSERTCPVNVMVRVTKDVNDNVVIPSKQSKSFGNLVSTLLEGYYSNKYVRAYVEGRLDMLEEESSKQFNDQIQQMMGSISSMGIFTEELKEVNDVGKETFENASEEKKQVKEDIMDTRVKGLEDSIQILSKQNSQILSLLQNLQSGVVVKSVEEPIEEVASTEEVEEVPKEEVVFDMKSFNSLTKDMFDEG